MIKIHAFSATVGELLSKIYQLDNNARVQNIPALLQNPTLCFISLV